MRTLCSIGRDVDRASLGLCGVAAFGGAEVILDQTPMAKRP